MSMEPTSQEVPIDNVTAYEFEFDGFTVCYENGIWWADFLGDDDDPVLILENESEGIYFDEKEVLLEVEITKETFDRLKEIVHEKVD